MCVDGGLAVVELRCCGPLGIELELHEIRRAGPLALTRVFWCLRIDIKLLGRARGEKETKEISGL